MLKQHAAAWTCITLVALAGAVPLAQGAAQTAKPFEPKVGQAGKDVVWVPTPSALVEKMLDMAKVTPKDYLIDLGSGDGRTVIAAARRGLRAHGIEYNPDMVDVAKRNAAAAGVSDRATFARADIFKTDFSKAQVVTMFLLQTLNMRLRPTLLDMPPGTRIVSNTFSMEDWEPDQRETAKDCPAYCTAMLWIVPAKVQGAWRLDGPNQKGEPVRQPFTVVQRFQTFSGTLGTGAVATGKLSGADITFRVGGITYTGRVNGTSMSGKTSGGGTWTARRAE
jgi:hypothetical protein